LKKHITLFLNNQNYHKNNNYYNTSIPTSGLKKIKRNGFDKSVPTNFIRNCSLKGEWKDRSTIDDYQQLLNIISTEPCR